MSNDKTTEALASDSVRAVDLGTSLGSVLRVLHARLRPRVTTSIQLAPDLPLVLAAQAPLVEILTNLIVHAVDAMPDRPATDNLLRVEASADGSGHVALTIADNGPGLEPTVRDRIFEPSQADAAPGLSRCAAMVRTLGGTLTVANGDREGTVFCLRLRQSASAEADVSGVRERVRTRRRVLVVDDDALIGRTIRRLLDDGYVVETEMDGNIALGRIAGGEVFDAILCDMMMPGLTGAEFAARLGTIAPALRDRCGFVTGGAFSQSTETFTASIPPDRILIKPFAIDDLVSLVERLLVR